MLRALGFETDACGALRSYFAGRQAIMVARGPLHNSKKSTSQISSYVYAYIHYLSLMSFESNPCDEMPSKK